MKCEVTVLSYMYVPNDVVVTHLFWLLKWAPLKQSFACDELLIQISIIEKTIRSSTNEFTSSYNITRHFDFFQLIESSSSFHHIAHCVADQPEYICVYN